MGFARISSVETEDERLLFLEYKYRIVDFWKPGIIVRSVTTRFYLVLWDMKNLSNLSKSVC